MHYAGHVALLPVGTLRAHRLHHPASKERPALAVHRHGMCVMKRQHSLVFDFPVKVPNYQGSVFACSDEGLSKGILRHGVHSSLMSRSAGNVLQLHISSILALRSGRGVSAEGGGVGAVWVAGRVRPFHAGANIVNVVLEYLLKSHHSGSKPDYFLRSSAINNVRATKLCQLSHHGDRCASRVWLSKQLEDSLSGSLNWNLFMKHQMREYFRL
mmetsp:Transcript_35446/g.49213  ORF Transcript_35446/g.49213 Transcript_35446/m.49213 type:complete len:213 (-) Transcript_35446:157-795(-)